MNVTILPFVSTLDFLALSVTLPGLSAALDRLRLSPFSLLDKVPPRRQILMLVNRDQTNAVRPYQISVRCWMLALRRQGTVKQIPQVVAAMLSNEAGDNRDKLTRDVGIEIEMLETAGEAGETASLD